MTNQEPLENKPLTDISPNSPLSLESDTSENDEPENFKKIAIWQISAILLALSSVSLGLLATLWLFRLPGAPNCHQVYLPIASASNRIYCAQLEAEKKTVEGLLNAITLVEVLPPDHPLQEEINQNVEEWAEQILKLGEEKFQQGKLSEAITIAKKVPSRFKAYKLVEDRINLWRTTWQKGEDTYAEVEKQLRMSNWNEAFQAAVDLTNLNNQYWATTKYVETITIIQKAQQESTKLDEAFLAMRRGGVDNLITAIQKAEQIDPQSYAYQEAQNLIKKAQNNLIKYVQRFIDNRNWEQLKQIAQRIPDNLSLKDQVEDWNQLASAGLNAQEGNVASLELALTEASKISPNSPLYEESTELISIWQLEVQDVTRLQEAKLLAEQGTINDYKAAIAEVELIPSHHPRYQEAQTEINSWNREIQIIEDQPILDRAQEIARYNNITAWQEAIAQASLIASNRPLYDKAQNLVAEWRSNVEREEDQPFLDQAINLGSQGNYQAAIDAASQIRRGRYFYKEAQIKISSWRKEIRSQETLLEAYRIAEAKTPETLVKAIRLAQQIPSSVDNKNESIVAVNRWSQQILTIASNQSSYSLEDAIRIARLVPSGTSAYSAAAAQVAIWKQMLQPIEPPQIPSLEPPVLEPEVPNNSREITETNYNL